MANQPHLLTVLTFLPLLGALAVMLLRGDDLQHETVAAGGKPFADARVELELIDRKKIERLVKVVLLFGPRRRMRDRPEVRVILEAEREEIPDLDLRHDGGLEARSVFRAGTRERRVEDRVGSEEPRVVLPNDDRTNLRPPPNANIGLGQARDFWPPPYFFFKVALRQTLSI